MFNAEDQPWQTGDLVDRGRCDSPASCGSYTVAAG